jgi:hypothetical protein
MWMERTEMDIEFGCVNLLEIHHLEDEERAERTALR